MTMEVYEAEKAKQRATILKAKEEIKELAKIQKEERGLLRQNHSELPERSFTWSNNGYTVKRSGIQCAGCLMSCALDRRNQLTKLHIEYNKMRGKPYDMHEYKEEKGEG